MMIINNILRMIMFNKNNDILAHIIKIMIDRIFFFFVGKCEVEMSCISNVCYIDLFLFFFWDEINKC